MDKRQLIDDIRQYNTSARPQFLTQFDEHALKQYLDHLKEARDKRVRIMADVAPARPVVRMAS